MTCIVLHNGYIVSDSAVRSAGDLDVNDMADLNKVHLLNEKLPVVSERKEKQDVCLGYAFSGQRQHADLFMNMLYRGSQIDNAMDYFEELRGLGILGTNFCFSIALICVHGIFEVECNPFECAVRYGNHGNYVEGEKAPFLTVMGSGSAPLSTVIDIAMTFAREISVDKFRKSGYRFNPMAVAAACVARDKESGGYLRLWRVVPDGKGSAELVLYGHYLARDTDRLLAMDLTEFVPLDSWNEGGDLPYDPIIYPDPPPFQKINPKKKKVKNVEGTAVPRNGGRSAQKQGSEGSGKLPEHHGQATDADQQGRSQGDAGRSGQARKRAGSGSGRSAPRSVGRRGKAD
ncbi:hypothetical protein [Stenotrophomonas sp. GD03657]|uniref:hypothetical protein n=1 Tax=Stenotrophomonas sp. GD03657 TaxID=2975363 RepID=UPI002447C479|nr:hypothetical protein [Stenotrophomonas sp. GD03657]MDH2154157.1 hypothetical protein [Stenotrophomonas sp. GD03657]